MTEGKDYTTEQKASALTLFTVDQIGQESVTASDIEIIVEIWRRFLDERESNGLDSASHDLSDVLWALYLDPRLAHLQDAFHSMAGRNHYFEELLREHREAGGESDSS